MRNVAKPTGNLYFMQPLSSSPTTRSSSLSSLYTSTQYTHSSPYHPSPLLPRATVSMADRDRPQPHLVQVHPQLHHRYEGGGGVKSLLPQKGPSTSQVIALITLIPVSGALLALAGIILVGTLLCLAVATPLFVIFSPVLVPAFLLVAGAVAAFLTSGAFGLTGVSSFSWLLNSFRQSTGQGPLDYGKRRVQEGTMYVGEKTKQAGEAIKSKAQEGGGRT